LTGACPVWPPLEPLAGIMLVTTVGFCAGGNTLLAVNPALRSSYPVAMMATLLVAEMISPSQRQVMLMALQVIVAIYLVKSSRLVHDDYWAGRRAQRLSEERARELELASLTDGLTQLPSRMYFDRQFTYEWARQCRHG